MVLILHLSFVVVGRFCHVMSRMSMQDFFGTSSLNGTV